MATWLATESWQTTENPQDASYLISPEFWKWSRKTAQRKAVSERGERTIEKIPPGTKHKVFPERCASWPNGESVDSAWFDVLGSWNLRWPAFTSHLLCAPIWLLDGDKENMVSRLCLLSPKTSAFSAAAWNRLQGVCTTTFPSPRPAPTGSFPRLLGEIGLDTACNHGSRPSRNRMKKLHAHRARWCCQPSSLRLLSHTPRGPASGTASPMQRTLTGSHPFMVYKNPKSFTYNSPFTWISTPDVQGASCGLSLAVIDTPAPKVTWLSQVHLANSNRSQDSNTDFLIPSQALLQLFQTLQLPKCLCFTIQMCTTYVMLTLFLAKWLIGLCGYWVTHGMLAILYWMVTLWQTP